MHMVAAGLGFEKAMVGTGRATPHPDCMDRLRNSLVPRPRIRRESGLVSTACTCANDSGNFPRTSPNTDKLHMVVMRRNNQTRYTACSVAAVFTRRSLSY